MVWREWFFWDREEHRLYFAHSAMFIQSPIWMDVQQAKLALGITCPRHRAIWKRKLGWFGRWIPDLEWQEDDNGDPVLVNVRRTGGQAMSETVRIDLSRADADTLDYLVTEGIAKLQGEAEVWDGEPGRSIKQEIADGWRLVGLLKAALAAPDAGAEEVEALTRRVLSAAWTALDMRHGGDRLDEWDRRLKDAVIALQEALPVGEEPTE